METTTCTLCDATLERVRYFPRQLITAEDMRNEQGYFREKLRRHNRYLHGWGVVCGFTVEPPGAGDPSWELKVCPGYSVAPQGDEILVNEMVLFDLKRGAQRPEPCTVRWPCPPEGAMPGGNERTLVYLAIRYAECSSRPVRVHPAGCGCDESGCEYSRIRDSFELKLLWKLPESHTRAAEDDAKLCQAWKQSSVVGTTRVRTPLPPQPCPECTDEPWVVLATIRLPTDDKTKIVAADISYLHRRVLYSTTALQVILTCQ
jgi:hypothetical protein